MNGNQKSPAITLRHIEMSYGKSRVLNDVNLAVEANSVHALIGSNGAGKTTLFNVITGALSPQIGEILFGDIKVNRLPSERRVRMGIGRTFQVPRVLGPLTVEENLVIAVEARVSGGRLCRIPDLRVRPNKDTICEVHVVAEQLTLLDHLQARAGELAHGDRKMLELAMVLMGRPSILLLDEPLAGVSNRAKTRAIDVIKRIADAQQLTVVIVEHDMQSVFALARTISVLDHGCIIESGTPAVIRNSAAVRRAYLGEEATC